MIYVTVYNIYIYYDWDQICLSVYHSEQVEGHPASWHYTSVPFLLTPKSYDKILWDEIKFKT